MPLYTDQMNRQLELKSIPKRIISLVPSQTELLFNLGLNDEIIGITKFCIHPADKLKTKTKVGGTKTVNIERIKKLNPDLIIGNKEENERSQMEELMQMFPVWMSDVADLDGAANMIQKIGEVVGKSEQGETLGNKIKQQFDDLIIKQSRLKVAYFIWRKPYIVAGKGTFIDAMQRQCGLINVFDIDRYPEVTNQMLVVAKPDVILLSSEPYPFKDKHINEFKDLLPKASIKLVDGELFSWYGSRLLHAPDYFNKLMQDINNQCDQII